jgi:RNA polymerase sigma-70 factor, ECF subfamily
MVSGPEAALAEIEQLEANGRRATYHYLFAVRADLLRRLGQNDEASRDDPRARELTDNEAERCLLTARLGAAT